MQVVLPDFEPKKWKDKFVKGLSYEVKDAMLFRSTRRTKLVDSPYELHFTDSTTLGQIEDLPINVGALYTFHPLQLIPSFLPPQEASIASLCVRDIIAVVVDITPLLKRERRGKTVKFVELYIMDPSIWPTCALLTVWDDSALKYGQTFLAGFTGHFVLAAQCVRPSIYKGKYGYQTNSFTRLSSSPTNLEAVDSLLKEIYRLAQQQVNTLHYPQITDFFRNKPLLLSTIMDLKASTQQPLTQARTNTLS